MNPATIILFFKKLFLSEFLRSLFWALAYKGAEKTAEKFIVELEQKKWIGDIPEKEAAKMLVDMLKGEPIPPNKRAKFSKMLVSAVYRETYTEQ